MPEAPKLTVLMPVRNGARYLPSACASVLSQADGATEFLVIDDGSTDATPAILRDLSASDARVRVLRQEGGGLVMALNHGLLAARAPLIARMDADDLSLPGRFARQLAYLDAHPRVAALGTGWRRIDAFGAEIGVAFPPASAEAVRETLAVRNCLAHSSVMFRREVVLGCGLYRQALTGAEDYDLWLRLSDHHDVENLREPLIALREHAGQSTRLGMERRILAEIGANWLHQCRCQGPEPAVDTDKGFDRAALLAFGMAPAQLSDGIIARALGAALDARRGGDRAATRLAARLVLGENPPRVRTWIHAVLLLLRSMP